ncbi:MAG: phage head-tail connector protein [Melioribacter sp.]|nr:phage head-tail connector protein [Melioribacter sp.]
MISIDEAITILQIEGTPQERSLIKTLIPEIEGDYKRIRNRDFDVDENNNIQYPEGSKLTAALMIGYILSKQYGIQSQTISKYSQTNEVTVSGYPKGITDRISKYPGFA